MKKERAPTLSAHLLGEAQRFLFYPETLYRNKTRLGVQETVDDFGLLLVEWRKTFIPKGKGGSLDFGQPGLLDELYCRDLLKSIPKMVDRTRRLSSISLAGVAHVESVVYLREAANCYILGLPQAAIALARAAIESHFRDKAGKLLGEQAVARLDLKDLLDDSRTVRLLSRDGRAHASVVRTAANRVLHAEPSDEEEALTVFEAARAVLLELSQR